MQIRRFKKIATSCTVHDFINNRKMNITGLSGYIKRVNYKLRIARVGNMVFSHINRVATTEFLVRKCLGVFKL